jgi:hypothetical protein
MATECPATGENFTAFFANKLFELFFIFGLWLLSGGSPSNSLWFLDGVGLFFGEIDGSFAF